ncbi:MAG TPA: HEAT repeat domain-containing protein [Burkholderiaceae bacterium]|nr:HEAT repeat domain-containing protein [Burkholderiaceae bacterium]
MEGGVQICPACFRVIASSARRCRLCGVDVEALSQRGYREKLVAALKHPLADVRMRAIIALGWQRNADAAQALVDVALRHERDVVQALAVVGALARLQPHEKAHAALATLAARHPAHAVQVAAHRLSERPSGESDGEGHWQ